MKKYSYLIMIVLISSLVLTGCLLSNVGQVPTTEQSGIAYLTKGVPFSDGLVGLWSFEEGEDPNIAYDSSGNNNDGTIYGAIYNPDQWGGQALSFDGEDDHVDCDSNVGSFNLSDPFTIEAWINPALKNKNNVIYGNAWAKPGYHVRVTLENKVRFILIQTGSIYKGIDSSVLTAGWHHIVAVWDGTSVKIYVDGEDDSKIAIENGTVTTITTTVNTKIGLDTAAWAHYFNGAIDEVRIYDFALSPGTIKDHSAGIYGFNGLMAPYAPPGQKFFKVGRTIPLKWQYTDFDGIVDSAGANPKVGWVYRGTNNDTGILDEEEDAPGASGLRYDALTMTWQFNWQTTKSFTAGQYDIYIKINQTGQRDGPFPIWLK